jgi:putative ABC transport system substrate-binding protein
VSVSTRAGPGSQPSAVARRTSIDCDDTHLTRASFTRGLVLGLALAPMFAGAQARAPRVGILSFGTVPTGANPDPVEGFGGQVLREFGYVEGQNIVVERRYADGRPDRLAALAAELVQLKVDVILAGGPAPLEAARKATTTIPIVVVGGSDPIHEGWAKSLARPGGNVTGLTVSFPELGPKHLELLKQAQPGISRVAVVLEILPDDDFMNELQAGARRLGLQLQVLKISGPGDIDAAFLLARQHRAEAIYAIPTNVVVSNRERLATLAMKDRLSSISGFPMMAQAGFLLSYGADLGDLIRRSVVYVDKILKGARPGDLAIERPAKFQLIVNLKTARTLGITIPQSVLVRADEVIQ